MIRDMLRLAGVSGGAAFHQRPRLTQRVLRHPEGLVRGWNRTDTARVRHGCAAGLLGITPQSRLFYLAMVREGRRKRKC